MVGEEVGFKESATVKRIINMFGRCSGNIIINIISHFDLIYKFQNRSKLNWIEIYFNNNNYYYYIIHTVHTIQIVENINYTFHETRIKYYNCISFAICTLCVKHVRIFCLEWYVGIGVILTHFQHYGSFKEMTVLFIFFNS